MAKEEIHYLKSIDKTLKDIHKLLDRSSRKQASNDLNTEVKLEDRQVGIAVAKVVEQMDRRQTRERFR